ncbi:MAG TPA: PAS domain-containing sensor histidine kinase [Anaeromyxobacter sp.]|nr:PAS domain-containing sensor histidine kinase [Anaeromyxobacter sp.]
MQRIHAEIARDLARALGLPLAQVLAIRERGGVREAETLAVEVAPPGRAEATALLEAQPGEGPGLALVEAHPPARVLASCEPSLAAILFPGQEGAERARSAFYRLACGPETTTLARLVLPPREAAPSLRALDAAVRLAAGRLEAEDVRRALAGRSTYRAFQESAGEAILVAEAEGGRVLESNLRLGELTGYGRHELRRLTLPQLLEHSVLDPGALLARLGSARVVHEDEARLRRRRGEPVPVSITTARLEVDGRPVLHLIARDVTREHRVLAELKQTRDTLAALHLAGAHLMVETDEGAIYDVLARELGRLGFHCGVLAPALDGGSGLVWRFLSFPPPLRRAIDRALERPLAALRIDPAAAPLVRRCLSEHRTVHTDLPRRAVQDLLGGATPRQLRRLGRLVAIRRVILAPLRSEGRAVAVLAVAAPRLRKGDPQAIDAFALQASIALEKARLFGALAEERAHLEVEVDRRTRELRQAVRALEETDRQKDNFLANISHELRTPLVTVLGYADLLLAERLGPLVDRQRSALQAVAQSGRRLKGFIEELLDLSRHELTKGTYAFAAFDLGEVARQAVLALAPRFAERGLRVRARVARGTPRAWGDRDRILQVLVNLLANAERYSPDGAAIRVAVAGVRQGRIEVAVTDRGAGIPSEHLAHIFERLYQVRDDLAPRHKGGALGIGLAIVKGIVEAHGGEVTVRSRVGHGSTFRFWLAPANPERVRPAGAGEPG